MGEMINSRKRLAGKPEMKMSLAAHGCRWEDSNLLKWILRKRDVTVWNGFIMPRAGSSLSWAPVKTVVNYRVPIRAINLLTS